jgi:purine nucleosidase/pyrimidine-specific ribonucleoside hydrolase
MPPPLFLDADPGHDDALAIVLAGHSPLADLQARERETKRERGARLPPLLTLSSSPQLVTTVASNHSLGNVTRNAATVIAAAGLGARVALSAGAARPLLAPSLTCPEIHGGSGLCTRDGPFADRLPGLERAGAAPRRVAEPAAVALGHAIRAAAATLPPGGRVKVVATGALTNVALLLALYPDLEETVDLTIMGGSTIGGNTSPVAEFNLQVDPHAAAAVLAAGGRGLRVTLMPLDVTHQALVTPSILASLGLAEGAGEGGSSLPPLSPLRAALRDVLLFFAESYASVFDFAAGPPLHDPVAVFAALAPHHVTTVRVRIDVETASPLSAGQTVVDARAQTGRPPNAWLATAVEWPAFWGALAAAIAAADAASPLNGVASAARAEDCLGKARG